MPTVRCKYCSHLENECCEAKRTRGFSPKVSTNKRRNCDKFDMNPQAMAEAADKEYAKRSIPVYAPTWRYYASDRELKELGEEKGPRYIRINPNV